MKMATYVDTGNVWDENDGPRSRLKRRATKVQDLDNANDDDDDGDDDEYNDGVEHDDARIHR